MDAWSLCYLLPVWSLISTLVRRATRRGGVGRYDPTDNGAAGGTVMPARPNPAIHPLLRAHTIENVF